MKYNKRFTTGAYITLRTLVIALLIIVCASISYGQNNGGQTAREYGGQLQARETSGTNDSGAASPIESARQKLPQQTGEKASPVVRQGLAGAVFSLLGSLVLVLGAFLIVIYFIRKITPNTSGTLPKDVLEKMGEYRLTSRHRLHLIKFANRFLLLSVCGEEVRTVSEVADREEVKQLARHLKTLVMTDHPRGAADPLPPTEPFSPKGER